MPIDAMIKAMGDLGGVLKKNSNNIGAEEMEVLKQLDTILSGPVAIGTENQGTLPLQRQPHWKNR
jgi:hypothetical protein